MYKILAVLAVCLLALGVAIGQSSTDQQQQSQSSATQQQQPSSQAQQSQSQSSQPQQDRSATGSASGSASGSVSARPGDQAANPNSDQQPARTSSRTGIR
jgi:cytoskeletal protein RodZ